MTTASYTFTVVGMHCASCGMLIDDSIEELPGVRRAQTSVKDGRTVVDAEPTRINPATIIAAIMSAGYQATLEP